LAIAGAEPLCTFFVDDSESHIDAARMLGINSHHFQAPTALAKYLAEHGILRDAA